MERTDKKRKCKTPQDLREYQLWYVESQQELEQLKAEKKALKQQIRMGRNCLKESFKTAECRINESEELQYDEKDEVPGFMDFEKEDVKHSGIEGVISYVQSENNSEEIKTPMVENVPEVEKKQKLTIQERVEEICDEIVKSGKTHDCLSVVEKAEMFEDYLGIYDETVKLEERKGRFEKDIESGKVEKKGRNR